MWQISAVGAGALTAQLAWHPGWPAFTVVAILLLPIWWAAARSRLLAAVPVAAYALAGARDVPAITAAFFPGWPGAAGVAIWLAQAIALTAPWALLWRPAMRPAAAAWRAIAASVLASVPPFGLAGWLTPLAISGGLYPGSGWTGVLAACALTACAAALARSPRRPLPWIAAGLLAFSSAHAVLRHTSPHAPAGWVGLDTRAGTIPPASDIAGRMQYEMKLIDAALVAVRAPGTRVVVLPEEIAGTWERSVALGWQTAGVIARARGVTVLVGADVHVSPARFDDSLVAIGAASGVVSHARAPMPVGVWHPWSAPSAVLDAALDNTTVIDGRRVAFSFCFEDFLFWPHALTMLRHRPELIVSVANNWFADGLAEPGIQARHIQLWADLWGVPLVRAVNRKDTGHVPPVPA